MLITEERKMKKIICALLALLMVLVPVALASCSNQADETSDTTAANANTGDDTAAADTSADNTVEETLDIPTGLDYDGAEFVILTNYDLDYNYGTMDFDEPQDDTVDQAYYLRNLAVEELLNITITEVQDDLGSDIYTLMKTDADSNTADYDIIFNNMGSTCTAVGAGYALNVDETFYIDLDKSWWNADATEQLALMGGHYMVAGDIATNDKDCIWVMYFMKDILNSNSKITTTPYDEVYAGTWTWDVMFAMADECDQDVNANGERDSGDIYGLCTHSENYAASWESAGLKLITLDSSGYPQVSWGTDEFVEVYEDIAALMGNTEVVSPDDVAFITTSIERCQTLFGTEVIAFAEEYRNCDYEFGIVPYPKYSEEVDRYYSYIAYNASVMMIEYVHPDAEWVGIVSEALAYYGQQILTPAYYEIQLQGRYSRDEESQGMLDIIFEYRCYDLGVFFDWGGAKTSLSTSGANASTLYASLNKAITKAIEKSLTKLGS